MSPESLIEITPAKYPRGATITGLFFLMMLPGLAALNFRRHCVIYTVRLPLIPFDITLDTPPASFYILPFAGSCTLPVDCDT